MLERLMQTLREHCDLPRIYAVRVPAAAAVLERTRGAWTRGLHHLK